MSIVTHRPFERSQIEQSIYSRFAEQVAQFPQRPAIWTPQCQWTYEELSARVDAMAGALLQRLGDGEGRVALVFDHNASMIAGMLAAMRAGKAYVPLDPKYPEQRLKMMLQDSSPEAILIEAKHRNLANQLCGASLPIVVEEDARSPRPGMIFPSANPRDIAYILYTSGSSGQPKGVVQNHRNVLHFIRAYTNGLLLAPSDRLTLLSSYSFDAAVMGIFGGILNGGCVCPFSVQDGGFGELGEWIRRAGISIYHSTPTVFREFLAVSDPSKRFDQIRRVVLGGESVVRRDVQLFKKFFESGTILVNGLGPTESTVTLQHFIDHDTELTNNLVPVGRPVCDTRIILLDEAGKESDREGELVFVSEHVALGYWRRPDLNAQSFGCSSPEGLRWYRSGDLARWREDGNLEFLGRKDSQIKISGVRIELGEIEAALQLQPGVAEAVAIGRTLVGSDLPRIIAYVRRLPEAASDERQHSEEIRKGVRTLLPSTMVPNIIVFLNAFPKTPTGKIDRLSLPEPSEIGCAEQRRGDTQYVAPTNEIERSLVRLWQDALGIEKVGVAEDFQSLGGDSLTALRLLFRMKTLGIPHNVARGILQGKTIRQIANPDIQNRSAATAQHHARINLLVNTVRGLLLTLVIAGHWLPNLVRVLPELAPTQRALNVIFDIATPGFAFVFGLTLGKIYYPKYRVNADQTRRMLRPGTWILLAGFAIVSTFNLIAEGLTGSKEPIELLAETLLNSVLLYYALAFATAPIWFRIISLFDPEYIGCVLLMVLFYSAYQASLLWLRPINEYEGLALIGVGLLTAKFNYLNMSFGVIAGCAAGIYLAKNVDDELAVLSRRFSVLGITCVSLGLFILFLGSGSLRSLGADNLDMGLWRWVLYSGWVIVLIGVLAKAVGQIEEWPPVLRRGTQLIAAFGQCTFPIFVMHYVVWVSRPLLMQLGIPGPAAVALLLVIFTGFSAWCVSSLYRLHYADS